jgi:hypothetical protein
VKLKITQKSGSLHQFIKKVKNAKGKIIEYPKVNGIRDINNSKHWEWHYTWREKIDDRWCSRCIRVKPGQVKKVKQSILESVSLSEIQAFLTQKI